MKKSDVFMRTEESFSDTSDFLFIRKVVHFVLDQKNCIFCADSPGEEKVLPGWRGSEADLYALFHKRENGGFWGTIAKIDDYEKFICNPI